MTLTKAAALASMLLFPLLAVAQDVEENPFSLTGTIQEGETWTSTKEFTQDVAGQIHQKMTVTSRWKVLEVEDDGGWTAETTLIGVSFEMTSPQGTDSRSYGEDDLARIPGPDGELVPFHRTWNVEFTREWEVLAVRGLRPTIEQLVEYAGYRLRGGREPGPLARLIPADVRRAAGRAIRDALTEGLTELVQEAAPEVNREMMAPISTVLEELREAGGPTAPGQEFGVGDADGNVRYLGTTEDGRVGHFQLDVPAVEGARQTYAFAIDTEGRLVRVELAQEVSAPGQGPVRQSVVFRLEKN